MKTVTVAGRKNCGRCGRWRSILDFRVQRWNQGRTHPVHLSSYCMPCHNSYERVRPSTQRERRRHKNYTKRQWRLKHWGVETKVERKRGKRVPVGPLQNYLRNYPGSLSSVARAMGVDDSYLYHLRDGRYKKNGKWYTHKSVTLGVVDDVLAAAGEHLSIHDLYPDA